MLYFAPRGKCYCKGEEVRWPGNLLIVSNQKQGQLLELQELLQSVKRAIRIHVNVEQLCLVVGDSHSCILGQKWKKNVFFIK